MKFRIFFLLFILTATAFAREGTGNFEIVGSTIYDPQGNEFTPKGSNVQGMKFGWPGDVVPQADKIIDAWQFNILRVNCRLYDHYWDGQNVSVNSHYQTIESMQALVDAFTPYGVVVMFEFHDRTGQYYTGNDLEDLKDAFREMATLWKDNPYVWFNIMNEPGGSDATPNLWVTMHREVIQVIRDEMQANNVIVVDAHYWGQDVGAWNADPVSSSNSVILSRGQDLINFNNKTYDNIMFSVHIYDQWNRGTPGQMEFKLHDYFSRVKDKGLALMVGEFGTNRQEGDLYFPEAFKATMKVAPAHGVGLIWWHWYGGDALKLTTSGNGNGGNINDMENPTNLTWPGKMFWDYSHHQGNRAPFVNIYSPLATKVVVDGSDLTIQAAAADYEDGIRVVRLYNQDQLVDTLTAAPYDFVISGIEAGRYVFRAVAVDSAGNENSSQLLPVNVSLSPHEGVLLFITGESDLTDADNALFHETLKAGYRIIHRTQYEVKQTDGANRPCIVISSSVSSNSVGTMFADAVSPVLVASPALFPVMKLTGSVQGMDYGTISNATFIKVLEPEHSITQGLSELLEVYNTPAKMGYGKPTEDGEILIATQDDAGKATLFIYPKHAQMAGMAATAARGGLFVMVEERIELTPVALDVFVRLINWLTTNEALPVNTETITGMSKGSFTLHQNFPNPVGQNTTISYATRQAGVVNIKIIDQQGKEKQTLVNEFKEPGSYSVDFLPSGDYSNGIYYYRIELNKEFQAKPMLIQ